MNVRSDSHKGLVHQPAARLPYLPPKPAVVPTECAEAVVTLELGGGLPAVRVLVYRLPGGALAETRLA